MLDILVMLVIFLYAFNGWRRGLILSIFSIVGYVVSLLVARAFSPKLTEYVSINTGIDNWIDNLLGSSIRNATQMDLPTNVVTNLATETVISVICFFIIFSITSMVIFNIGRFVNGIGRLPVIGELNRFGGLILGTAKGLLLIFIILALSSFVVNTGNDKLGKSIENTILVDAMYKNNPILYLISEIFEPINIQKKEYIKNTLSSKI